MNYVDCEVDECMATFLQILANEGIHNAARGISSMLGQKLAVEGPIIRLVPLIEIPDLIGGPEIEATGIYLQVEGKLSGQIIMVVPNEEALEMVDLLMGNPPGTAEQLGVLERSALAEMGNLTGSFFLNAVTAMTGLEARPSPPAVMVDMVGAILDVIIASMDDFSESVLMIHATLSRGCQGERASFWLIPERQFLDMLAKRGTEHNAS